MKKYMLAAFLFVFIGTPAAMGQMDIGGFGGMGFADYSGYSATTESDFGIHLGLSATKQFTNDITGRANLGFTKFFTDEYESADGTSMVKVEPSLSEFFIDCEALFGISRQWYSIVGLGLHFFTMEYDVKVTTYDNFGQPVTASSTSDDNETKVALNLGVGYKINEIMSLEARSTHLADVTQIKVTFNYKFTVLQ